MSCARVQLRDIVPLPLLAAVVISVASASGSATATARSSVPGGPPAPEAREAVLVFVSVAANLTAPVPVAELREEATRVTATRLAGGASVPASAVEQLQRHWRVRTATALPAGFVAALASELNADRLV